MADFRNVGVLEGVVMANKAMDAPTRRKKDSGGRYVRTNGEFVMEPIPGRGQAAMVQVGFAFGVPPVDFYVPDSLVGKIPAVGDNVCVTYGVAVKAEVRSGKGGEAYVASERKLQVMDIGPMQARRAA